MTTVKLCDRWLSAEPMKFCFKPATSLYKNKFLRCEEHKIPGSRRIRKLDGGGS